MFQYPSCLILVISSFTGGPLQEEEPPGPSEIQMKVLDSFGDFQFLVSVGSKDGVRKGLKGWYSDKKIKMANGASVIPDLSKTVEFTQVGKDHSVIVLSNAWYSVLMGPSHELPSLKVNDSLFWYTSHQPSVRLGTVPPPGTGPLPGGAIIDLTDPRTPKAFRR